MFDSITSLFSDTLEYPSEDSHHEAPRANDDWNDNAFRSDDPTFEPSFHNAFGCGPDFIVPAEASSEFPSFELTENSYGSLFDDSSTLWSDGDW